jgi:hypothetical protein
VTDARRLGRPEAEKTVLCWRSEKTVENLKKADRKWRNMFRTSQIASVGAQCGSSSYLPKYPRKNLTGIL